MATAGTTSPDDRYLVYARRDDPLSVALVSSLAGELACRTILRYVDDLDPADLATQGQWLRELPALVRLGDRRALMGGAAVAAAQQLSGWFTAASDPAAVQSGRLPDASQMLLPPLGIVGTLRAATSHMAHLPSGVAAGVSGALRPVAQPPGSAPPIAAPQSYAVRTATAQGTSSSPFGVEPTDGGLAPGAAAVTRPPVMYGAAPARGLHTHGVPLMPSKGAASSNAQSADRTSAAVAAAPARMHGHIGGGEGDHDDDGEYGGWGDAFVDSDPSHAKGIRTERTGGSVRFGPRVGYSLLMPTAPGPAARTNGEPGRGERGDSGGVHQTSNGRTVSDGTQPESRATHAGGQTLFAFGPIAHTPTEGVGGLPGTSAAWPVWQAAAGAADGASEEADGWGNVFGV